jgi:signal transduction histidine kinase
VVTRYVLNPQSGKVEIHGVARDISERRTCEAAQALSLKHLKRSESEQRQMMSMASHEFRTPAAIIKTSLDSLTILKDRIPPEIAQRLENIGLASLRLTQLANRLISNERLQELACHPKKEIVELNRLVHEVVKTYPIDTPLHEQLPTHPVLISADATLLDIALHNLIDNALRYHATSDSPICISLNESSDMTGQWVEIRVADLGQGITDGDKEKIFERFYSTKVGGNNGLGLSIVHFVARAHSGTATVIDNAPCGSVFVIKLPVAHALQSN